MKRAAVLLAVLFATGCGSKGQPPTAPEPDDGVGDFSNWPTASAQPIVVDAGLWQFDCRAETPEERREREAAQRKERGPHFKPVIVVRTNPDVIDAFRARAPLPVGAVVVKEKHENREAKGPPVEYAAMIKREAGYDAPHGDWEYVFVVTRPERKVTRGKLESCVNCHSHVRNTDYLFRNYLPK